MILLVHNRYRVPGGEERLVGDLTWLIREHLHENAEVFERDSGSLSQRAAAEGLLRGGLAHEELAEAVRRTGARVVHAHNLNPTLGWRAREAGARVVLHLHNYRLVCAVGTCFTRGADCTRCHGHSTLPGVKLKLPRRLRGRIRVLRRFARSLSGPHWRQRRPLPRPERVRAAAPTSSRRAGRRPCPGDVVGTARVRQRVARGRAAATSSMPAG